MESLKWYEVLEVIERAGGVPRVLLWGPPGTGKTSWAAKAAGDAGYYRVAMTRSMTPDDLIGGWRLADGNTVWVAGPAVRALTFGKLLLLDEVDQASPDVESLLHVLLDDPDIVRLETPTGTVRPAPGYRVVATTNQTPDSLPEAIRDRFAGGLTVYCDVPTPDALARLPQPLRGYVAAHYERQPRQTWTPALSYRSASAYVTLLQIGLPPMTAAQLVWGPEMGQSVHDALAASAVSE